jgi:hypothetical protein
MEQMEQVALLLGRAAALYQSINLQQKVSPLSLTDGAKFIVVFGNIAINPLTVC